jgi:hypothetical protein
MALLERVDAPTGPMAAAIRMRIRLDELEHSILPEMLDRFAAGAATGRERRAVVRHLLEGCPSCRRRLGRSLPMEHVQEPEGAYDQAIDRSVERALDLLTLQPEERETPARVPPAPTAPATRRG